MTHGFPQTTRARRGLVCYFALTLAGTAACDWHIMHAAGSIHEHRIAALALMWMPGLASIATRLLFAEGFADLGLRAGTRRFWRSLVLAWLFPLAVGLTAYPLAWSTGLEGFSPPLMRSLGIEHAPALAKLACSIAINLTLGTLLSALSATGEELGWRGYMLPRLIAIGVPQPIFLSGVIWASWHAPIIATGQYAVGRFPALSLALFALAVIAQSYLFARVRMQSGSVWPAIVLHAGWNALIQGTFDTFTAGGSISPARTLWTGEGGVLVVAVTVVYVTLAWRATRDAVAPTHAST